MDIAPPPSPLRRIVAAPLYAAFDLSAAVERALPEWVPPTLDAVLNRGQV